MCLGKLLCVINSGEELRETLKRVRIFSTLGGVWAKYTHLKEGVEKIHSFLKASLSRLLLLAIHVNLILMIILFKL